MTETMDYAWFTKLLADIRADFIAIHGKAPVSYHTTQETLDALEFAIRMERFPWDPPIKQPVVPSTMAYCGALFVPDAPEGTPIGHFFPRDD